MATKRPAAAQPRTPPAPFKRAKTAPSAESSDSSDAAAPSPSAAGADRHAPSGGLAGGARAPHAPAAPSPAAVLEADAQEEFAPEDEVQDGALGVAGAAAVADAPFDEGLVEDAVAYAHEHAAGAHEDAAGEPADAPYAAGEPADAPYAAGAALSEAEVIAAEAAEAARIDNLAAQGSEAGEGVPAESAWGDRPLYPGADSRARFPHTVMQQLFDCGSGTGKVDHVVLRVFQTGKIGERGSAHSPHLGVVWFNNEALWTTAAMTAAGDFERRVEPDAALDYYYEIPYSRVASEIMPMAQRAKTALSVFFFPGELIFQVENTMTRIPVVGAEASTLASAAAIFADADPCSPSFVGAPNPIPGASTAFEMSHSEFSILRGYAKTTKEGGGSGVPHPAVFRAFADELLLECGGRSCVVDCKACANCDVEPAAARKKRQVDPLAVLNRRLPPAYTFNAATLNSVLALVPTTGRLFLIFREFVPSSAGGPPTRLATNLAVHYTTPFFEISCTGTLTGIVLSAGGD